MIKKCTGCGAPLTLEKGKIGYTNNLESELCMRCFNIKNYNKYEKVTHLEEIKTIIKEVKNTLDFAKKEIVNKKPDDIASEIERLKGLMSVASKQLDFEQAIELREQLNALRKMLKEEKK